MMLDQEEQVLFKTLAQTIITYSQQFPEGTHLSVVRPCIVLLVSVMQSEHTPVTRQYVALVSKTIKSLTGQRYWLGWRTVWRRWRQNLTLLFVLLPLVVFAVVFAFAGICAFLGFLFNV